MRTRPVLFAFAVAAGTAASATTGAHQGSDRSVVESAPVPVRAETMAPVVVTPSPVVATTPTTTAAPTPATDAPKTTTSTTTPSRPYPVLPDNRDDAITIETADNGGFFTIGDGPATAGSATSSDGADALTFYAYCSGDEANTLVCRATLTNNSDKTVRFPSGLSVFFKLTPRSGEAFTIEGRAADVTELPPGATAELRTHDTRTLAPGTYDYSATSNVVW